LSVGHIPTNKTASMIRLTAFAEICSKEFSSWYFAFKIITIVSLNVGLMTQLLGTDRASCFILKKVVFYTERSNPEHPSGAVLKKFCKLIAVKFARSGEKIYFYAH
jgi:hypothetical protein